MKDFYCEECNCKVYELWEVTISSLTFELCAKCTEENKHNADLIEEIEQEIDKGNQLIANPFDFDI
jgi:hypothetical protein